jgi:very-short-patch-repair endonuclease
VTDNAALLKRLTAQAEKKVWEDTLYFQIKAIGLPLPEREAKWHPSRDYRGDFFYRDKKLLFEVDGGQWLSKSGHAGAGYAKDRIRDCEAVLLGILTVRFVPEMIKSGLAIQYLEKIYRGMK